MNDTYFTLAICMIAIALYMQTYFGGYVWDDRAAIVGNGDVKGETSILELFMHDFWGQDIKLIDSHKSYRPITTLSFRMNHEIHGLRAGGFHLTNVLIYASAVILVYITSKQWLSSRLAARICVVLFCFHPVHVEGVASLVGRADALCCCFYLCTLYAYTNMMRSTGARSALLFLAALSSAIFASLSKEVGMTVFGLMPLLEVAHSIQQRLKSKDSKHRKMAGLMFGLRRCMRASWVSLTTTSSLARITVVLISLGLLAFLRVKFNGEHKLYSWSELENHIHLLPSFTERTLSYAQTHFWYMWKLFYPRHLCFDYGYACIPTIHNFADIRNVLPLLTYLSLIRLACHAIAHQRVALLVGMLLLLLPLIPALNILFPIGTTLAERLLFIPSVGFSFIAAELLAVDFLHLWPAVPPSLEPISAVIFSPKGIFGGSEKVGNKNKTNVNLKEKLPPSLALFMFILCSLSTVRIISRNADWASEMQIYRSALDVCPLSAKALTNFAVLCANDQATMEENFHNCLAASYTALDVYNKQYAAYINAGVVHTKLTGRTLWALWYWSLAGGARGGSLQGKANGYYGSILLEWMAQQNITATIEDSTAYGLSPLEIKEQSDRFIIQDALRALDDGITRGFTPPSILLARGSVALDVGDYEIARRCLDGARLQLLHSRSSGFDAPQSDHAPLSDVCSRLGLATLRLGLVDEASAAYECALEEDNGDIAALSGLALILQEKGMLQKSREYYRMAVSVAGGVIAAQSPYRSSIESALAAEGIALNVNSVPSSTHEISMRSLSTLLNNLGLVELQLGRVQQAIKLFSETLQLMQTVRGGTELQADSALASQYETQEKILQANLEIAIERLGTEHSSL